MNGPAQLWADPRLVYPVAAMAVALLLVTLWLFGRKKRQGRQAAVICLMLSVIMHAALIFLVPMLAERNGGSASVETSEAPQPGVQSVEFSSFDPDLSAEVSAGSDV